MILYIKIPVVCGSGIAECCWINGKRIMHKISESPAFAVAGILAEPSIGISAIMDAIRTKASMNNCA